MSASSPTVTPASTVRSLLRHVPAVLTPTQGVAGATAHRTCRWIEGEYRRGAPFCGAPAVVGCSWCAAHRARVFATDMRPTQPQED